MDNIEIIQDDRLVIVNNFLLIQSGLRAAIPSKKLHMGPAWTDSAIQINAELSALWIFSLSSQSGSTNSDLTFIDQKANSINSSVSTFLPINPSIWRSLLRSFLIIACFHTSTNPRSMFS